MRFRSRQALSRNLLAVVAVFVILGIVAVAGNYILSSRVTSQSTLSQTQTSTFVFPSNTTGPSSAAQGCIGNSTPPDKIIKEISVGTYIGAIAYDPPKNEFFVVNDNFYGLETNGSYDAVYVIDGTTNQPGGAPIPVGSEPSDIAYDASNGNLYVANYGSNSVSVINGTTNSVSGNISVETTPMRIAYDPFNQKIYVSDVHSGSVSVIDTTTNKVIATVSVGGTPTTLQYDALNHEMYVADSTDGTLTAINSSSNLISKVIVAGLGPTSMAYLPDTTDLYYATQSGIFVINSSSNEIIMNLTNFSDVNALGYDPDNHQVYVAGNASDGFLSLLQGSDGNVSYRIMGYPWTPIEMAFDSMNGDMYVSSSTSTIYVISNGINPTGVTCSLETTSTSSQFTPENMPLASESSVNPNGLQLQFSTNETRIKVGQTITFNMTIFNTFPTVNNVTNEYNFAYPYLTYNAPCSFAYDAMVLGGYYTISNITSPVLLQSWQPGAGASCPVALNWWDNSSSTQFDPHSSSISFGSTPQPLTTSMSFNGYWNETQPEALNYSKLYQNGSISSMPVAVYQNYQPGIYTIVAGDEWGDVCLLYFIVSS